MYNNKSMLFKRSNSLLSTYIVFFLLIVASRDLFAASQYFVFNGRLTTFSDPYTRTAIKAGYELDDFIHYVVEMDFDRQGYYISPTSGTRVTPVDNTSYDYFFANLISGTEIIHNATSGVVFENLGANHIDPAATSNQSYINLASYLVLINGTNPIDWKVGDEVHSSDRWTTMGTERLDGTLTLIDIADTLPSRISVLNNWTRMSFDREIFNFFIVHPDSNTNFLSARPYGGLYQKTNNSSIISKISNSIDDTNIKDLAFLQNSTNIMYAATIHGGIYKTENGGVSWIKSNEGIATRSNQSTDAYSVAISESNPDIVYCGTLFGLYKSTDAGSTWQLETTPFNDTIINSIRITLGDEIVVGTNSGLYMGAVGGSGWTNLLNSTTLITDKGSTISDVKLHPNNGNIVALGVKGSGAYFYHLDSDTWEKLGISAATSDETFKIDFSGASGNTVYVAASQAGLFRSDDFNLSWNQITLPTINDVDIPVNNFVVDVNERLMIGSNHNGLYTIEKAMQLSTPISTPGPNDIPGTTNDAVDNNSGGGGFGILTVLLLSLFGLFRCKLIES